MASLLFVTTLSLSANPRLYKEILCANGAGHDIHVICFRLGNWTDVQDDEKMQALPGVRFTRLSATRKPFIPWMLSSLLEQAARRLANHFRLPLIDAFAAGKRTFILEMALRKCATNSDWVIAHNPAAFLPAKRFAARAGARIGFDVEDYHPGEISDPGLSASMRRLMCHTLNGADYVSFAAPLIRREVARDTGGEGVAWMTVLNWFSARDFSPPAQGDSGPLRLVWFSQMVSARRGLELVLPAIIKAGKKVELHIFGQPDPAFTETQIARASNIFLHGPVKQSELHQHLAAFDIGLAIDVVADRNRELAITNKILAFLQAGLYLAVTETEAQRSFMTDYPAHGKLFRPDIEAWERLLQELMERHEHIRAKRLERYNAMRSSGWEIESSALTYKWASKY